MTDLLALADRVKNLTGPSDAIDREIANALGVKWSTDDDGNFGGYNITPRHIRFTASLDAAMTLVPENWRVMRIEDMLLDRWDVDLIEVHSKRSLPEGGSIFLHEEAKGHTGPLALTAACLRARASTDKGEA